MNMKNRSTQHKVVPRREMVSRKTNLKDCKHGKMLYFMDNQRNTNQNSRKAFFPPLTKLAGTRGKETLAHVACQGSADGCIPTVGGFNNMHQRLKSKRHISFHIEKTYNMVVLLCLHNQAIDVYRPSWQNFYKIPIKCPSKVGELGLAFKDTAWEAHIPCCAWVQVQLHFQVQLPGNVHPERQQAMA